MIDLNKLMQEMDDAVENIGSCCPYRQLFIKAGTALSIFAFIARGDEGLTVSVGGREAWVCDPEKNTSCHYHQAMGECHDCHLTLNKEFRWIPPKDD